MKFREQDQRQREAATKDVESITAHKLLMDALAPQRDSVPGTRFDPFVPYNWENDPSYRDAPKAEEDTAVVIPIDHVQGTGTTSITGSLQELPGFNAS